MLPWPIQAFCGTTGSLQGHVKEKVTGEPLAGVNVSLVQTKQGRTKDARGFFKIHNIRAVSALRNGTSMTDAARAGRTWDAVEKGLASAARGS